MPNNKREGRSVDDGIGMGLRQLTRRNLPY